MNRNSTIFLQVVILLIGISTLTLLLWEPHLEGVNAHATTLYQIYFDDPFLAYAYTVSIAFFVGLYQTFKALEYVRQHKTFSPVTVKAVRTIKYCAIILITCIGAAEVYLILAVRGTDDIAGGVAMGLGMIFVFVVIATTATMLEGILRNKV